MQGQVTFLNQNGLIPFGITKSKSQNVKKTRCFDGKSFHCFFKNTQIRTVANCTEGNLRKDIRRQAGGKKIVKSARALASQV